MTDLRRLVALAALLAGAAGAGVIPRPAAMTHGGTGFVLGPRTVVVAEGSPGARAAAEFVAGRLRPATGFKLPVLDAGGATGWRDAIVFTDRGSDAALGMEGYELAAGPASVVVRAPTAAGLFYGAQTLRLLLPGEAESPRVEKPLGGWTVPAVAVRDSPRFAWRGLLLDSGRHFLPPELVKRYIDLLAMLKMNRLHWHLTEDQGWRLEIPGHPRLTEVGAWQGEGDSRKGGFYTREQVRAIVAYAAARHVTIVPEIEMPGHCRAALACYPELSCTGGPFRVSTVAGVHKDVYCAGNDATFAFLEEVLTAVMDMFPGSYIHLGADEVPRDRWKACPKCQARIRTAGLKDEDGLQAWFIGRMAKFVEAKGRAVIGWDEVLDGGPPVTVIVQHWRGDKPHAAVAAARGHEVIVSPYTHCYLDYDISWYNLERVHGFDPLPAGLPEKDRPRVMGMEGCAWEMPPEVLDAKVFPRLLALAESGWSPREGKDFAEFEPRARDLIARLERMGVVAGMERWPDLAALDRPVIPARLETTMTAGGRPQKKELALVHAFDGSLDSYYWSPRPPSRGDTVTVTLERPAACTGLKLYAAVAWAPLRDGVLEVSADGRRFETVARAEGALSAASFKSRKIRAFRLRFTRDQDQPVVLREFVLAGAEADGPVDISRGWRLRAGDDPRWAGPDLDEGGWTPVRTGVSWTRAGFPDLHGYAWLRTRFRVPEKWRTNGRVAALGGLRLDLGPVDDVDETYLNGELVGTTGKFPPGYRDAWAEPRGYLLPARLVRWNADNVLAVRVYDGGNDAGLVGSAIRVRIPDERDAVKLSLRFDPAGGLVPAGRDIVAVARMVNEAPAAIEGTLECSWTGDRLASPGILGRTRRKVVIPPRGERSETFSWRPPSPGVYPLRLSLAIGGGPPIETGAMPAYDPGAILRPLNRPAGFDRFWEETRAELAAIPVSARVEPRPELSTTRVAVSQVELRSLGNVRIRGWLGIPRSPGPHPGIVIVPGYGASMEPATRIGDAVTLALDIRGHGASTVDLDPGGGEIMYIGLSRSPSGYFYAGAFMDCIRGVDYLASLPEVDAKRIGIEGGSQGGGLSLATAALDGRIAACAADVPWLGDWPDYEETAPWAPENFPKLLASRPDLTHDSVFEVLSYFDVMNLADRIRCPVIVSMGLRDDVCPPRIILSTYNRITAPKELHAYPDGDHGGGGEVHDRIREDWMRRMLARSAK